MSRIKNFFYSILKFFGLIDTKNELSRTNLLVYIFCYKLAAVPLETASIEQMATALAAAMGAMGVYVAKKVIERKSTPSLPEELLGKLKNIAVGSEDGEGE
jgi:hypothetical protein